MRDASSDFLAMRSTCSSMPGPPPAGLPAYVTTTVAEVTGTPA